MGCLILLFIVLILPVLADDQPIRLHPENPHYFLFRGRPTLLVTSGEHYGAVLNLDFDYIRYLEALKANRLNLTRIFSGVYLEAPGDFGIKTNSLAPTPDRFICPWPRSGMPGAADGLNRFDLSQWNDAYFVRLKDFVAQAGRRGIVVEFSLFCPYYREGTMWNISPLNAKNNINGIGDVARNEILTLKNSQIVDIQDVMVRKIVNELRNFDNLYYEICNEPYFGPATPEWEAHIAATIHEAEASFLFQHLIAQNIANRSRKVDNPNPSVSLFNFHYSRPPDSVAMNYALNKAIGYNETGWDGTTDAPYRIQGWDFLIAGGALYNNLDYSFTVGHEDGSFVPTPEQPGGGSRTLRHQLGFLRSFLEAFDFLRMAPAADVITAKVPMGASVRVLAEKGKQYVVYLHHGQPPSGDAKPRFEVDIGIQHAQLTLNLPAGYYKAEWVNTKTGSKEKTESFSHKGGAKVMESPSYTEDIALRIAARRRK